MKITLNTETANMLVSIMRTTGGSISKTTKDAFQMYLDKLQTEKDHYDPPNAPKDSYRLSSSKDKS